MLQRLLGSGQELPRYKQNFKVVKNCVNFNKNLNTNIQNETFVGQEIAPVFEKLKKRHLSKLLFIDQ